MSQRGIEEAVAMVTGDSLAVIQRCGFSFADPPEVNYDLEPRRPLVFDWDRMSPVEWPVTFTPFLGPSGMRDFSLSCILNGGSRSHETEAIYGRVDRVWPAAT
jgi:hypothetical protein